MKHIKPYKIFESDEPNFPTTREEVIEVCEKYEIENYAINDDLSIDVDSDVYLDSQSLEYLPLKFNYVSGNFNCFVNKLTDLEHFPEVSGDINIGYKNPIYSLVYTFIKKADSFMIEDFNDYEIVRNGNTVMLDRLQTFIEGFDLEMPNLEEVKKHYKIIE